MSGSSWTTLLRLRQQPDPSLPALVLTVYRDNFDGLVLFVDDGDGQTVIGVPLSDDERQKLAETLLTKEVW